jgi:hypothetical protein
MIRVALALAALMLAPTAIAPPMQQLRSQGFQR